MDINTMLIGPYILKVYRVRYFIYLDFFSPDELMRLVRFPLGPKEFDELDTMLRDNNFWGISGILKTPILNTSMDRYSLTITGAHDFPCEEDDYLFKIDGINPHNGEYYTIISTMVSAEDLNEFRRCLLNIVSGGYIK